MKAPAANAIECLECFEVVEGTVDVSGDCETCGAPALRLCFVFECPTKGGDCSSDDHDWGSGNHIVEVQA